MTTLTKNQLIAVCLLVGALVGALLFWAFKPKINLPQAIRQELSLNPQLLADLIVAHPELFTTAMDNARSLARVESSKPPKRGLSLSGKMDASKPEIIEYYNLACSTCKNAHKLLSELKIKENFQVTLKHVHMDKYPQASIAAQFLEVLYQHNPSIALKFLEDVFDRQSELMDTEDIQGFVSESLRNVGVSEMEEAKILEIIKEEKIYDRLAQYREEAKGMRITSTPSFVIKNKVYQGLPPREIFKNILGIK